MIYPKIQEIKKTAYELIASINEMDNKYCLKNLSDDDGRKLADIFWMAFHKHEAAMQSLIQEAKIKTKKTKECDAEFEIEEIERAGRCTK